MCFGAFRQRVGTESLDQTEATGQPLWYLVWFVFGAAMLRPALSSPHLARSVAYAVLSLTVVRMVPVAIALIGTRLGRATVGFIGWFGPRGLASVIFALLAFDQLGHDASTLLATVSITVAFSVVLHGLSAPSLVSRHAPHAQSKLLGALAPSGSAGSDAEAYVGGLAGEDLHAA